MRPSRTNFRTSDCSCAWEEHWSEEYQKYYYFNRETGQTSWHGPANRKTGAWDGPANLKVFQPAGNLNDEDAAARGSETLAKGCRTPEETKLFLKVKGDWLNLQRNLMAQDQIAAYVACMDSPDAGSPNIDSQAEATAAEGVPVMAHFLGDMWKEMRMFKNPFLKEQLLERAAQLKQKEPDLREEYKNSLANMKRQEEIWANEADSSEEDRNLSQVKAAKLQEGLQEEEEAEAYDEEEDAKLDNQDENEEAQEAAEEALEEKAMAAELEKARQKVTMDKTEEELAEAVAESVEDSEHDKVTSATRAHAKKSKPKPNPEDRLLKPGWMRELEGQDARDGMEAVSDAKEDESDAKESYPLPRQESDVPEKLSTPAEEKSDLEDDARREDNPKANDEKEGTPKPMFTESATPPVSTAVRCVILLAWVYFIFYTALAIARTVAHLSGDRIVFAQTLQTVLEQVKQGVEAIPVFCVLFLATRLRAVELTKGDTLAHGLPQEWVQLSMLAAAYGLIVQIILKLVRVVLFGKVENATGSVTISGEPKFIAIFFVGAKYLLLLCIYVGVMAVCIGAIGMRGPKEVWGDSAPPVSAALLCVAALSSLYFAIDFIVTALRLVDDNTYSTIGELDNMLSPRQKASIAFFWTKPALNLVPMLCILFLLVRTWALQLNPDVLLLHIASQACIYLCAGTMIFQVVFSIIFVSLNDGAFRRKPSPQVVPGIIDLNISSDKWKVFGTVVRLWSAAAIYGGSFTLVAMVLFSGTPAMLSATTRCTVGLTTIYFLVLSLNCIVHQLRSRLQSVARTLTLVPMLCLVFMAARIRVLQLTRTAQGGIPLGVAPPAWVQNAMYFASLAMVLQLLMAYLTGTSAVEDPSSSKEGKRDAPLFPGGSGDDDKRVMSPSSAVAISLAVVMHLCLVFMLFGVLVVMAGIVSMRPETLPPYSGGGLSPHSLMALASRTF